MDHVVSHVEGGPRLGYADPWYRHKMEGGLAQGQLWTSELVTRKLAQVYKSYRTHGIVKKKIECFISRFSILYDSMSSNCVLSRVRPPRNPRQSL